MKNSEQLLQELEVERAELDAAISVLRRKLSADSPDGASKKKSEATRGEYKKLSVPKALERYAASKQPPRSPREIGELLKEGGIKSKSRHYNNIIRTALNRQGPKLGLRKLEDGRWEAPARTREERSAS